MLEWGEGWLIVGKVEKLYVALFDAFDDGVWVVHEICQYHTKFVYESGMV